MARRPGSRPRPSRQGVTELVLLVAFLAIAAAGGVAVFGPELRAAFGQRAAPPAPAAPAP